MRAIPRAEPADWMNVTLLEGLDRLLPGWRNRSYGDLLSTSPADWWAMMYPQYARTGASPLNAAGQGAVRQHRPHQVGCRCDECDHCRHCKPESCECFCCIGDVDLVVYARVGETRVIPIVVENERRREKSVSVELSPWRSRGGSPAPVDTVSFEPKTFVLAPCAEREITVAARRRQLPSGHGRSDAGRLRPSADPRCGSHSSA